MEGEKQDEVNLTYFKGPKSYNGENILELSVHGNILNIETIIKGFIEKGNCRLAKNGEFTYRALKNKKLTLSQVEGLDLLINAQSSMAFHQGLGILNGELKKNYLELREVFLKFKASIEINIDFSEDVGEEIARSNLKGTFGYFKKVLCALYDRTQIDSSSLREPSIASLPEFTK